MTPEIILVFAADCPNVDAARTALRRALGQAGCELRWAEVDRDAPGSPAAFRLLGSPTILVDGADVVGVPGEATGASCRLYPRAGGLQGVPPTDVIRRAIRARSASPDAAGVGSVHEVTTTGS